MLPQMVGKTKHYVQRLTVLHTLNAAVTHVSLQRRETTDEVMKSHCTKMTERQNLL